MVKVMWASQPLGGNSSLKYYFSSVHRVKTHLIFPDDATGYGPIFEEEPVDVVYTEDSPDKSISMNCRARSNPPASYRFHKDCLSWQYTDVTVPRFVHNKYIMWCVCTAARWRRDNWEIKLMEQPDEFYSLVGGNLVITNPKQKKHAGTYVCVAKNIYGTVISKEARVKFGCEFINLISISQGADTWCSYVFYNNDPYLLCSFGGVFWRGERSSLRQRRTGSSSAVCRSKSLAPYVPIIMSSSHGSIFFSAFNHFWYL